MDRLGVGQALVNKGVTWKNGKVFFDEREVFTFDLLPEEGHRRPAFINLQAVLLRRSSSSGADRASSTSAEQDVQGLEKTGDGVLLTIGTPEGRYPSWRSGCSRPDDGARSTMQPLLAA